MTHYLAAYNFGVFKRPAEDTANAGWRARHDPLMTHVGNAPGFIARSGYEGDPGPDSWGKQIFPRFYEERGDGWSPATLSLWQNLESLFNFTYTGLHREAFSLGNTWFERGEWPPYVLWWVPVEHQPIWSEGVARFEHLHDHGPTSHAFHFKQPFDENGQSTTLRK